MKNYSKFLSSLFLAVAFLSSCPTNAYSEDQTAQRLKHLEQRVNLLEMPNIVCGPVTISDVSLGNQKTFVHVQPGQQVECSLHFALDSSQQAFLDKHHLVVGIEGVAAETCIAHLYGVWNSKGTRSFTLVAPLKEGDYEVKVAYYDVDTCEEAFNAWNVLHQQPYHSTATIGMLRVRASR